MVQRVDDECTDKTPIRQLDAIWLGNMADSRGEVNDGVDQTDDPFPTTWSINAKGLRERQVGTVGSSLIPSCHQLSLTQSMALLTLSCCTHGTETDRVPKHLGSMPLVVLFVLKCRHLLGVQLPDLGKVAISSHESRPTKEVAMLGQTMGFGKLLCLCNDPFSVLALHLASLEG